MANVNKWVELSYDIRHTNNKWLILIIYTKD